MATDGIIHGQRKWCDAIHRKQAWAVEFLLKSKMLRMPMIMYLFSFPMPFLWWLQFSGVVLGSVDPILIAIFFPASLSLWHSISVSIFLYLSMYLYLLSVSIFITPCLSLCLYRSIVGRDSRVEMSRGSQSSARQLEWSHSNSIHDCVVNSLTFININPDLESCIFLAAKHSSHWRRQLVGYHQERAV